MELSNALYDPTKRSQLIADCCRLVEEEVASKFGASGIQVKAGYSTVKGVEPEFITKAVDKLLNEFAVRLEPILDDGKQTGNVAAYLTLNKSKIADALLAVTDHSIKSTKSSVVQATYEQMRGSAKKNVEDAVPRLSKLLQKYME